VFLAGKGEYFFAAVRHTMSRARRKQSGEKDLTDQYLAGDMESAELENRQQFSKRSKSSTQNKIQQTASLREAQGQTAQNLEGLPVGQVVQVFSLYYQVESPSGPRLCVVRKTLAKLATSQIVVGDLVRFRDTGGADESGQAEAVIEQVLPRKTLLVRTGSFHGHHEQPIVANADQMLIVASIKQPRVKWGLVDRMLIAAQGGGLVPILCATKMDLVEEPDLEALDQVLDHYRGLGIRTLKASAVTGAGIDGLADVLRGKTTVLAGHSGVGKSTLINAIQPGLGVKIGQVSVATEKGRHTTTSAQRYELDIGGAVIDTPGIKQFGLWGVNAEKLMEFYPDVNDETAPAWRVQNYQRLLKGLS
jgi:ribosome biogenesis GTPase